MQFKRSQNDPFAESEAYGEQLPAGEDIYRAPQEEPAARQRPVRESVIDAHSTFDGKFETDQDLRIEGTISGEIVCRGLLTIEGGATAKASIEARDAHIRGRLDGEITCAGRLELAPTAVVDGTVRASLLVVQEGAAMNGTVETRPAAPAKPEPRLSAVRGAEGEAPPEPAPRTGNGRPRPVPSFALSSSDSERNGGAR